MAIQNFRKLDNASAKQFKPFFEQKIDVDSKIKTDGWRGYWPLQTGWTMEKQLSERGKISRITCSPNKPQRVVKGHRLQNNIDEFHCRINWNLGSVN